MAKNKKYGKVILVLIIPIVIVMAILAVKRLEEAQNVFYYDFEDDKTGTYPGGFVGVLRDTEYTRVVYFDESHRNVVEIRYLEEPPFNPIIGGGMEFNTLFGFTTAGIIEFDVYLLYNKRVNIDICQTDAEWDTEHYKDDVVIRMPFSIDFRYIAIMTEEGVYENVEPFHTSKWYSFKIEFDLESWRLWINNDLIQSNRIGFIRTPEYFCQLYFATYELGSVFYVDNVKISILERY